MTESKRERERGRERKKEQEKRKRWKDTTRDEHGKGADAFQIPKFRAFDECKICDPIFIGVVKLRFVFDI